MSCHYLLPQETQSVVLQLHKRHANQRWWLKMMTVLLHCWQLPGHLVAREKYLSPFHPYLPWWHRLPSLAHAKVSSQEVSVSWMLLALQLCHLWSTGLWTDHQTLMQGQCWMVPFLVELVVLYPEHLDEARIKQSRCWEDPGPLKM